MKRISLVVSGPYQENKIFDRANKTLNRDDCLAPFYFLRDELKNRGYDLQTNDLLPPDLADLVIYNEMPKVLPSSKIASKSYLLILESPLVVKNSWKKQRHQYFKRILTWNDEVIDGNKFIKVNYTFDIPKEIDQNSKRQKLCTLISAHKISGEKNELYSERIKAIRWFEENAPNQFDLYGMGWDRPAFKGIGKALKKIPFLLKRIPFRSFPSYRGKVADKRSTLHCYNFAICYENVKDLRGYITEKIFDCLFAGTIPIYLGAKNIADYIPANCFIDKRDFETYDSLYQHINSMTQDEIAFMQRNIATFLEGDRIGPFKVQNFSKQVADLIERDIV